MVPSGPPTSVGGAQSGSPSVLIPNSGVIGGGQGVSVPSQSPFSSLVSPRTQFSNSSNAGLLGNMPNVSSLLNQSFGNGPLSAIGLANASVNLQQRGSGGAADMVGSAEPDPLSFAPAARAPGQNFQNPSANQMGLDGLQSQQRTEAMQNFQQFSLPHSQHQQLRGALGNTAAVKLEPQMGISDQSMPPQQLQSFRSVNSVKLEPHVSTTSLGPVKMETHQQSDPALFMQQQQQQQQILHMPRQSTHAGAHINLLQQQRMIQLQQQQQQHQVLKSLPQQRLQQQQQLQQQAHSFRSQVKTPYEPGMCARRLTHYMYHQKHRPSDNNIEFWRKFAAEYFAPHAKKRWCVSLYGSGRQTTGVFPQDVWHCEICNRKPGRGFETTVEVLPRLYKIKYDSGTLEELLYVDMPREYQNASGQIVLDYAKAVQESVFEHLRVVRDGQLRIVFSSDLKICSWEFCARRHEELIPRRLIIPQVSHLGQVAQKYQAATQNGSSSLSAQELQNSCNLFVTSARQLAKALEVPLVNDLGYTKRYVRCLQIAEVVNCMKDLIDYSRETGTGPMESLVSFPRRSANNSSGLPAQTTGQPEEQHGGVQNSNHDDRTSARVSSVQLASGNNGVVSVNSSLTASPTAASTAAVVGLQSTINSRQENNVGSVNSPYGCGNAVQIPSASSSNSLSQSQANPTSPFPSSSPASNNTAPQMPNAINHLNSNMPVSMLTMQPTSQTSEGARNGSQHSMQQILQEMLSTHLTNGGSLGSGMKGINGVIPGLNGGNCLVGNGIASNIGISGTSFENMSVVCPSSTAGGIRAAMSSNSMALNGRVGMNQMAQDPTAINLQQQDLGNRLLSNGFGAVNSLNSLQFDWKTSP